MHFSVQGMQFSFLTYLPVSCRTKVIMFLPRNVSEPIDGAYDVVKQVKIKATHASLLSCGNCQFSIALYSCSRNSMRLSVEGWVLNRRLNQLLKLPPFSATGCMMNSCCTSSCPSLAA